MRFDLAREAGLTEERAALVNDDWASAELDQRWHAALSYTDHFLTAPGPMPSTLVAQVTETFDPASHIELGLGLGLFHGFSKMLIALGLEPDDMDTTVLDTPAPLGIDAGPPNADPHLDLLEARPDLGSRWAAMASQLRALPGLPETAHEAARLRLATLYGVDAPPATTTLERSPASAAAIDCAERFALDIRSLGPEQLATIRDAVGFDSAVIELVMTLAVYDGMYRFWATSGPTLLPPA